MPSTLRRGSSKRRRLEKCGSAPPLSSSCVTQRGLSAEAAAREGITCCRALEAIGERGWLSTAAGQTAHALLDVGRDDEAEHWIRVADAAGSPDDVITQVLILEVRARLCSRRGDQAEAEALARAAVVLVEQTDMLEAVADSKLNLAGLLKSAGNEAEAIEEAVELYERKGHLVGAA